MWFRRKEHEKGLPAGSPFCSYLLSKMLRDFLEHIANRQIVGAAGFADAAADAVTCLGGHGGVAGPGPVGQAVAL